MAQSEPGWRSEPSSAASLSRSPENGARISSLPSSFRAAATAASAACIPDLALSTPARAASTAAAVCATRVSEANPPWFRRAAARPLISASTSRASASGKRSSASRNRASASFRATCRVPGSRTHSRSPSITVVPRRAGSLITLPEVSARTSTCRAASVRPRRITAPSTVCATERNATTEMASPAPEGGMPAAPASADSSVATTCALLPAANFRTASRSSTRKYSATTTRVAVRTGSRRMAFLSSRPPANRPSVPLCATRQSYCRDLHNWAVHSKISTI